MAGKNDMDRLGYFKEMSYHTVGDPYKSAAAADFNTAATKGRQMLPGGTKSKSGLSHGYMSDFSRVFEGEAYSDAIRARRLQRINENKKQIGKNWMPSSFPKLASGTGSHFGTFSGPIQYFNAHSTVKADKETGLKNIMTNPPKKGTGYGYAFVGINKYPDYKGDTYEKYKDIVKKEAETHRQKMQGRAPFKLNMHPVEHFDTNPFKGGSAATKSMSKAEPPARPFKPTNPGKKDGGMKAGTFDPFPTYTSEKYGKQSSQYNKNVVNSTGKTFIPNSYSKSTPMNSILSQNVARSVNSSNYKMVQSVMSY